MGLGPQTDIDTSAGSSKPVTRLHFPGPGCRARWAQGVSNAAAERQVVCIFALSQATEHISDKWKAGCTATAGHLQQFFWGDSWSRPCSCVRSASRPACRIPGQHSCNVRSSVDLTCRAVSLARRCTDIHAERLFRCQNIAPLTSTGCSHCEDVDFSKQPRVRVSDKAQTRLSHPQMSILSSHPGGNDACWHPAVQRITRDPSMTTSTVWAATHH